jgi:hypothetical protein
MRLGAQVIVAPLKNQQKWLDACMGFCPISREPAYEISHGGDNSASPLPRPRSRPWPLAHLPPLLIYLAMINTNYKIKSSIVMQIVMQTT